MMLLIWFYNVGKFGSSSRWIADMIVIYNAVIVRYAMPLHVLVCAYQSAAFTFGIYSAPFNRV